MIRMRILVLANNDVGLYQFRKELIEELLKKHEVIISLPYGELVEPLKQIGCEYIETCVNRRGVNPFKDMKLLVDYFKLLKQVNPDLVITYTIKPNVYGGIACRLLKISYVVNVTGLGSAFENSGFLKKIVTIMNRIACKDAKVVFFENEQNKRTFIGMNIIKETQAFRLDGAGVNLNKYQIVEYPKGDITRFLFIGRVMAEKGVDELFCAIKQLVKDGFKCELDVLGGYEENYKNTIEQYEMEGWLHYYGYQKDVRPFISKCHCFVLPSWHEGMANTNLECAASGRPVITTRIPGCMEAVIDGKTGFLVERKNTKELYNVMKRFMELSFDDRVQMGSWGREHMEKTFDRNKVVKNTLVKLGL